MAEANLHKIYIYPQKGGPCEERASCAVSPEGGLEGNRSCSKRRSVTLLSAEVWADTMADLGVDLPPETRRANLLVGGVDLVATVGKHIRIGEAVLKVWGETEPCQKMDDAQPGLLAALTPQMRGGVCAEVLEGGLLEVGAAVEVVEPA